MTGSNTSPMPNPSPTFFCYIFLLAALCIASPLVGAENPLVLEIWPGTAPEETGDIGPERFRTSPKLDRTQVEVTEQTKLITAVTKPTITIHPPPKHKNSRTAVLICPG